MNEKNIFISYGHNVYDNAINLICEDLRKAGFNVFLDIDYLNVGDWEDIIDEHIKGCKYFVYFISSRSTAHNGYCLNELCRAGEFGLTIIPIKLDESLVPLSINRLQRLSLVEAIKPDGSIIDSVYQKVITNLLSIINGETKLGFSSDETRLKTCLNPISSREDLFRYYSTFCGRKEAFKEFERFLDSDNQLFWLPCSPGSGKTAFSSMLCWNYPDIVGAAHFCKFNNSDKTNPKYIFSSIAYHLSEVIPELKQKLYAIPNLENIFEKNAYRIFEYLIIEPLTNVYRDKPVAIVIDAADECTLHGENEVCTIIQRVIRNNELPKWLKIVVTSRNEVEVSSNLLPVAYICKSFESHNDEDLKEYYLSQLGDLSDDQLTLLLSKTEGSFLYASEICKQILSQHVSLNEINYFPVGIYGFYNDCFNRIFHKAEDITFQEARPILEYICISLEAVDENFLCKLLNYDIYKVRHILNKISNLFPIRNHQIEPLHKSLIDWLTNEDSISHNYFVSKKNGYLIQYNYFKNLYSTNDYEDEIFIFKYFANAIIELGYKNELYNLLNDLKFQTKKIQLLYFDTGISAYIEEIYKLSAMDANLAINLFTQDTFKEIFSIHRRLLYNSGLFFRLKDSGLSSAFRNDTSSWSLEGEIGKVFYYYIVEIFDKAIAKAKQLIANNVELQTKPHLLAELYNVKGLSERKIVAFDDALESFDNALINGEAALDLERIDNTDPEFEISLAHLIKGKIYTRMLDFTAANKSYKKAVRTLSNEIEEMINDDKKISNLLFLAEDYRVFADSLIWEGDLAYASEMLTECDNIYFDNKATSDRYYIRYRYISIFQLILEGEYESSITSLKAMLNEKIKGKYDIGQINFLLALAILKSSNNEEELQEGMGYAKKGYTIYESIDAYLEKDECLTLLKYYYLKLNITRRLDFEENPFIEVWRDYIEERLKLK